MSAHVDKAAPWDGVPENPEKDGWHWLCYLHAPEITFAKAWRSRSASHGLWADTSGHKEAGPSLVCLNYRYLGPCFTPSEVATTRAEAFAAGALAMKAIAFDAMPDEDRRNIVRAVCEAHMLEHPAKCTCMNKGQIGFGKVPAALLCRDTAEEIIGTVMRAIRACGGAA